MLATSTLLLPTLTGRMPERLTAARPDGADGIRLVTAEASQHLWPDHGDYPPLTLHTYQLRLPWCSPGDAGEALRYADGRPAAPARLVGHEGLVGCAGETADPGEYSRWQSTFLLTLTGSAALVADVIDEPGVWPADAEPPHGEQPDVWHRGAPVRLESWQALRAADRAALWLWSAADRAEPDGRRSAKERDQALEGTYPAALAVAQALHDALSLLLPAATTEPPPAPTNRRSTWR